MGQAAVVFARSGVPAAASCVRRVAQLMEGDLPYVRVRQRLAEASAKL
jgi:hypothetical protein